MSVFYKILIIVGIIIGLAVLALTAQKIYLFSSSGHISSSQDNQPGKEINPEIIIERVVLKNLKVPSLNEALVKFTQLSQEEKTNFIEAFVTEAKPELIKALVETHGINLLANLPQLQQRFIRQMFGEISNLPPQFLSDVQNMERLAEMLGVKGSAALSAQPVTITFATRVNNDNLPNNKVSVFKSTDYQIYACFPTAGRLKDLRLVQVKWINLDSGNIIYQGYKLISSEKPYNFVWVKYPPGWRPAKYQVQVFNLQNICLAEGNYEVKEEG